MPFPSLNFRSSSYAIICTLSLVLSGCGGGGGSSSSPAPEPTSVNSNAIKGPLENTEITLTDSTDVVIDTFTANGGSFVIDLPNGTNFPVTVTSSGGVDSILGNNVADESLVLKSVIFEEGQTVVNLNPFTTLMVDTALAKGGLTQENIDAASDGIAAAYSFGLPDGFNPVTSTMDDSNSPGLLMSFEAVFEVFRRVSKATGGTLNEVINNIAADLSDDVIDGVGSDGVDSVSTALFNTSSADVLIESLAGTLTIDAGGPLERSLVAEDINSATALITGNAASETTAGLEPTDTTKAQAVAALNVALRSADPEDQDALGKAVNFIDSIDAQNPPTAEETASVAAAAKESLDNVSEKNTDPDAAAAANDNASQVFSNPDNNFPLAIDDVIGVPVGSDSSALNILANDTGLGDTPIVVSLLSTGAGGSATLNADNTVAFVPDSGFFGQVAVEYEVTDADDETTSATALLFVDDQPVLENFDLETDVGTALTIDVGGSATGLGNTPVGFSVSTNPSNGTLTGTDGVFTYTPGATFAGVDTAVVVVEDADGDTAESAISIFVDDQPIAVDDMVTTPLNTSVTASLLDNDSGLGNGPVAVTLGAVSSGGTAQRNGDTVTFTPSSGFGGTVTVAYTVTDTDGDSDSATLVVLVDDIPVANADSAQTIVGAAVTIPVLLNDTGLGNTPISLTAAAPTSGSASVSGSEIIYTPNGGFTGNDTFVYTVVDADGDQASATVSIFVDALAVAGNDGVDTQRDAAVVINVLANDNLGNIPTSVLVVTQPSNGAATLSGSNILYTPNAGFGGLDSFTYQITDSDGDASIGTVTVNVDDFPVLLDQSLETPLGTLLAVNLLNGAVGLADAPIVLVITVQPTNGTLSAITGTSVDYTPNPGFAATDTFQYTATDNNGDVDTATISVLANDTPAAGDDLGLQTPVGAALNINVLANDIQLGNIPITVTVDPVSLVGGITVVNGDDTINFTPTAGFGGQGSFTYTVTDNDSDTATASVQVFVEDIPVAVMDSVDTPINTAINIDVLANDTGKLNTPLIVTVTTAPAAGSTAVEADKTVTYTPNPATVNTDNFSYTLSDSDGDMSIAAVAVYMDDTPVAVDDTAGGLTTEVATLLNVDVTANDTGTGNSPLTISVTPSANAAVTPKVDETLDYTPNAGFAGDDSFTYSFTDSDGDNSGVANVNVFVNDTPAAVNDSAGTQIDTPVVIDVLANDTGKLNVITALTVTTAPTGGAIDTINVGAGTLRYVPDITGLSNNDSFQYQIEDTDGQTSIATVLVGVGFAATSDTVDVVENISDTDRILGSGVRSLTPLVNDALGTDGVLQSVNTAGTLGTAVINGTSIDYTPPVGVFGGSDSFQYTISSTLLMTTSTATVTISIVSMCSLDHVRCVGQAPDVYADIQSAVDDAVAGDWVKIKGGTYVHAEVGTPLFFVEVDQSGTAGNPISIESFDGEQVILQGFGFPEDGTGPSRTSEILVLLSGEYINLRNIEAHSATRYCIEVRGSNTIIEGNTVHDCWLDNINVGRRTDFAINNVTIRNNETFRSRHGSGLLLSRPADPGAAETPPTLGLMSDILVERNLSYNNGRKTDGNQVPPIGGDPAGGGNSDAYAMGKQCLDELTDNDSPVGEYDGVNSLCLRITYRQNVGFGNIDDGFDTTLGNGSILDRNISFGNGPEGRKGFKFVRDLTGDIKVVGNVAFSNLDVGLENRFVNNGFVFNNTAIDHLVDAGRGIIAITNPGANVLIQNNMAAKSRPNNDFSIPSDGTATPLTNHEEEDDGDPVIGDLSWTRDSLTSVVLVEPADDANLLDPNPSPTDEHDPFYFITNFAPGISIDAKVEAIIQEVTTALMPQAGSPLIDAGTFNANVHCATADDDPVTPHDSNDNSCHHWNDAAPDIGAFETDN
ncbi:MAG: hypothetical protein ACI9P7_000024 [Candidatus Azotimanducaceae bacterium]|jgi:hypothetical protein